MASREKAGGWRRTGLTALAAIAVLGAGAAPALGAVVGGSATSMEYAAAAGETNNLRVTQAALTVVFDDDVAITTTNPACTAAGGDVSCTVALSTFLDIALGDLNDTTTLTGVTFPTTQFGDDGNDVLRGGGDGDFFSDEPGSDTYAGGDGFDGIGYVTAAAINVTLDSVANDGIAGEADNVGADIEDVFSGGTGPDTLTGSAASNTLAGSVGDDQIDGGTGNDTLSGADGNDTIRARDGVRDKIRCGSGRDKVLADDEDSVTSDCERVGRA